MIVDVGHWLGRKTTVVGLCLTTRRGDAPACEACWRAPLEWWMLHVRVCSVCRGLRGALGALSLSLSLSLSVEEVRSTFGGVAGILAKF